MVMEKTNIKLVGDGQVHLIAGGGKIYTDMAARFVRSEKTVYDIIHTEYNPQIVKNIIESGHGAALEFDFFIFGVEGYSRVTETQLVRKRHASYLIKSGRAELGGKRMHNYVAPKCALDHTAIVKYVDEYSGEIREAQISGSTLADICSQWYESGLDSNIAEEDLRYLKPQATEFKAIIGMNAHALRDWFKIRCCRNAQKEIRDLANKMLKLCKEAAPDLFEKAGANCVGLGYCPENRLQHKSCRETFTHNDVLKIIEDTIIKSYG